MTAATGQQPIVAGNDDFNAISFIVQQMLSRVATSMPCKVLSVTNSGGVSPVGFVSIQPLVNQTDGAGNATPHGTISNIPYVRAQGGASAVIIDPAVGDIGLVAFCSRDISSVKASKGQANPGSRRRHDMADGIYTGTILGATPTNFIQFRGNDVNITATGTIGLTAGGKTLTIGSAGITIDGILWETHEHSGVQTGSGNSGPPVVG